MREFFRNRKIKKARGILIALVMVNIFTFFMAKNVFINTNEIQKVSISTDKTSLLENGWKLMSWSYNFLEYFRTNPPG